MVRFRGLFLLHRLTIRDTSLPGQPPMSDTSPCSPLAGPRAGSPRAGSPISPPGYIPALPSDVVGLLVPYLEVGAPSWFILMRVCSGWCAAVRDAWDWRHLCLGRGWGHLRPSFPLESDEHVVCHGEGGKGGGSDLARPLPGSTTSHQSPRNRCVKRRVNPFTTSGSGSGSGSSFTLRRIRTKKGGPTRPW